jgi:hypothetical protein
METRGRWQVRPFEPFVGTVTKKPAAGWLVEDSQGETVLVAAFRDVAPENVGFRDVADINVGDRVEVEPRHPVISGVRTSMASRANRHTSSTARLPTICYRRSGCRCSPLTFLTAPMKWPFEPS